MSNVLPAPGPLELSGDTISFPLMFNAGKTIAYFHMDYGVREDDLADIITSMGTRYKSIDGTQKRERSMVDETAAHKFVMEHLKGITPVAGDPDLEQMKAWLDKKAHVKSRIFREGYDRIEAIDDDDSISESNGSGVLNLSLDLDSETTTITARRWLYCPDTDQQMWVSIDHVMTEATTEDWREYRKAVKIYETGREQTIVLKYGVLAKLYRKNIKRLDGAVINGQTCTEANKKDWVERVLLNDKVFVVNTQFDRTALKNG